MTRFIIRRIIRGLVALILFQSLLFVLMQAVPYDFSVVYFGSPRLREMIQTSLGLNLPWHVQYFNWLTGFFRLDLGTSFLSWPVPVSRILGSRAPRTLLLFFTGVTLAYMFGIWLGKEIAWRRDSFFESAATLTGVAAYTSFAPWLGFLMLNIFAWWLGWFPYQKLINPNVWYNADIPSEWLIGRLVLTGVIAFGILMLAWTMTRGTWDARKRWGYRGFALLAVYAGMHLYWYTTGYSHLVGDLLGHLALPLGTVILLSFGETMLVMRTTMLETVNEEYVLMARAKGLPDAAVRDRHAARNAILPVLTRLLLNLPFIFVGSLAVELVFQWDAMGQLIFNAIEFQDVPLLMGILSFVGVMALTAHIILDILHVYLDPRLRYEDGVI